MNCKPGDLAVYVHSDQFAIPENAGQIFEVLRRDWAESALNGGTWWEVKTTGRALDDEGKKTAPGEVGYVSDAHLRPIRPGDISDEEVRDLYAPKVPEAA